LKRCDILWFAALGEDDDWCVRLDLTTNRNISDDNLAGRCHDISNAVSETACALRLERELRDDYEKEVWSECEGNLEFVSDVPMWLACEATFEMIEFLLDNSDNKAVKRVAKCVLEMRLKELSEFSRKVYNG
jgi:hypothetical protein